MDVPEKTVHCLSSPSVATDCRVDTSFKSKADLNCGTDSPVRMDSSTTTSPDRIKQSAGAIVAELAGSWDNRNKSPGYKPVLLMLCHLPSR
uniref:Uncharacterized protein n=1 Tax=Babesia bovis TaxID=5865 RepID=S6B6I2_BABBO|nr:hypothetical protein [Babesia bovis]